MSISVEYDSAIDSDRLEIPDFRVEERTVTKVHANTSVSKAGQGEDGLFFTEEILIPRPKV